jgi:hypothetical protein
MSKRPIIDGTIRVLGIVGHPIAQVRAPEVWTGLFQSHGINMICVPFHVLPEHLASFFAGLRAMKNLAGMIVTIPHKPASVDSSTPSRNVRRWCDRSISLLPMATANGAAVSPMGSVSSRN